MSTQAAGLPINKGLLDARSVGRTLVDLNDRFYPVDFFDLCSIIEEIVLRDEIVLVGKFNRLPLNFRSALQPFIDAHVFNVCLTSTRILRTTATDDVLRSAAQQAVHLGLTSTSLLDSDYAVTRLLGAEADLKIPTIPLLQHLHNYQFFRRPILDDTVCDLVSRYDDLKKRVEYAKATDFRRLALKPVRVPPIALQVMQRARTFDQICMVTLEVREEFRALRDAMRRLAETFADPGLSSAKYFRLVHQWEEKWQRPFLRPAFNSGKALQSSWSMELRWLNNIRRDPWWAH
jgi:hypothetical protein